MPVGVPGGCGGTSSARPKCASPCAITVADTASTARPSSRSTPTDRRLTSPTHNPMATAAAAATGGINPAWESQNRKNAWNASVTAEKPTTASRWAATTAALVPARAKANPTDAAPITLGIVIATHAAKPNSRYSTTGRNMPTHHVHDIPR
jgi:hypothetical protein